MAETDELLIAACRRGEAGAWKSLIDRYQRLVYSVPRRYGLDDAQCADVFQHVFVRLFEHLDRIEQPDRLGPWLVMTAKREAWRLSRQMSAVVHASDEESEQDDLIDRLPDHGPAPDEAIANLQEQHAVRLALEELDERCRQLLRILFYRQDALPYADIAAQLGVPEGSIGPTRARCLQKLRRILEK